MRTQEHLGGFSKVPDFCSTTEAQIGAQLQTSPQFFYFQEPKLVLRINLHNFRCSTESEPRLGKTLKIYTHILRKEEGNK